MTLEIDLGGRRRTVSVERAGHDRYRVTIDGHGHVVDALRIGEFTLSLILDGEAATSREAVVARGPARGELLVGLDGRTVPVTINGRNRRSPVEGSASAEGEQAVVAPMPGRVVRVLVGRGDAIAERQGVIVVEAMKMENELRSPKAGSVKEVAVAPGQSVEAGRVLVIIE